MCLGYVLADDLDDMKVAIEPTGAAVAIAFGSPILDP
jgi:hypothetical protein